MNLASAPLAALAACTLFAAPAVAAPQDASAPEVEAPATQAGDEPTAETGEAAEETAAQVAPEAEEDKRICRRIRTDMSSRRKTRVCLTADEWREMNQRR